MKTAALPKLCETCGSRLDLEAPSGFCAGCLLETALELDTDLHNIGTSIGEFELLDEIARGGMGIVYRARQRVPGRVVALKMILPAHVNSTGAISRFRAEAEAAASLDHEAILPIYAVGENDGAPFYSMKFAEGGSLSERMEEFKGNPRKSAMLIASLARAIEHAHQHGILHRDLKPANVLFDAAGNPFVSDFGLAKWLEREGDLTQTLAILGTPFYMAPEQAAGAKLTSAADIYSLGAILFHLLTGRPPFQGDNAVKALREAAEQPPPMPRSIDPRIPRDLQTICLKCLEKDPSARYASASALAGDLERYQAGRAITARPASPAKHVWRWVKHNPLIFALGVTSAALLIGLLTPVLRSAPEDKQSIAVLPFENLSGETDNAYFASGIHDELLVNLSKIAGLKVISRNSVLSYKGDLHNLPDIRKTLGVNAVVEGSVRHIGNRVRITVELIDARSDSQLWAETYDREITDAFAMQSDVAFQIASALKATLTPEESAELHRPPTKNGQAYLLYIQANDYYAGPRKLKPDLERAEQLYEKAIQLDPSFALAYARLSRVESVINSYYELDPARRSKAEAAAYEALRLQPNLAEGHKALAEDYWRAIAWGKPDLTRALHEYQIALRGLPNDPDIYSGIGRIERHQGKWAEACTDLEKAASLDPRDSDRWHRVVGTLEFTRNYAAAAAALDRAIALSPNRWELELHRGYLKLMWKGETADLERLRKPVGTTPDDLHTEDRFEALVLLRRYDEAENILRQDPHDLFTWDGVRGVPKSFLLGELYFREASREKAATAFAAALPAMEKAERENPATPGWPLLVGKAYAALGRKDGAIREGKHATEFMPETKSAWDGTGTLEGLAQIYAILGDANNAIPILQHLLAVPSDTHKEVLRIDPTWDPIRNDPRFQKLLEEPEHVFPVALN